MITKIHEGKKEYGSAYWQGLILMIQGRKKGCWQEVTKRCTSLQEAEQEMADFIESVK